MTHHAGRTPEDGFGTDFQTECAMVRDRVVTSLEPHALNKKQQRWGVHVGGMSHALNAVVLPQTIQ